MKRLLIIGCVFITIASCNQQQSKNSTKAEKNCSDLVVTSVDKFTDKPNIYSQPIVISSGDRDISLGFFYLDAQTVIMDVSVSGVVCLNANAEINILFKDSSKLTIRSNGSRNCKGEATVYLTGPKSKYEDYKQIHTKRISAIRIHTTDSIVDGDLTEENSNNFLKTLNCIVKTDYK